MSKGFMDPHIYFPGNKLVITYFYLVVYFFFPVTFFELIFNAMSKRAPNTITELRH